MKNKKKYLVFIGLLIIILLLVIFFVRKSNVSKTDADTFKSEYEELNGKSNGELSYIKVNIDKNNPIIYSSPSEIISKINDGDLFTVYFGSSKNNDCRTIVGSLIESAKDKNVSEVFYIDTDKYGGELDELEVLLKDISDDENINYTSAPSVVAIAKKRVVQRETGITTKKNKKAYAKNQFNCLFKCLSEESNTCSKNSC